MLWLLGGAILVVLGYVVYRLEYVAQHVQGLYALTTQIHHRQQFPVTADDAERETAVSR